MHHLLLGSQNLGTLINIYTKLCIIIMWDLGKFVKIVYFYHIHYTVTFRTFLYFLIEDVNSQFYKLETIKKQV